MSNQIFLIAPYYSMGTWVFDDPSVGLMREQDGGNWYRSGSQDREGWLCPALFMYFDEAPEELCVKAEAV